MPPKILMVDDSRTFRLLVRKVFESFECELFEAENGKEGLEIAGREKPDLIILDITMPVMNGEEMLKELKKSDILKGIPVIMLTAESEQARVLEFAKIGIQDYMVKPLKGGLLIKAAKKVFSLRPRKDDKSEEDTSCKYFSLEGDIQLLKIPEKVTRPIQQEVEKDIQVKSEEMSKTGIHKFLLDLSDVDVVNMPLIKLTMNAIENCRKSKSRIQVVAKPGISNELKEFEEMSRISFDQSVEDAKAAF